MNKYLTIIIIVALLAGGTIFSSFYMINTPNNVNQTPKFSVNVLGQNEFGTVTRYGPYGNVSSPDRIAYIVGVHPLEYQAHNALVEIIKTKNKTLQKCYYIYQIDVTDSPNDYNIGRANGQNLAQQYAVPDIKNNSIKLAIDVHSNEGNWQEKWFLYIPASSLKAEKIAQIIKNNTNWLTIYTPPNPTSPIYVTIPLIEAGIPSIIYETYTYESVDETLNQTNQITSIVDKLTF